MKKTILLPLLCLALITIAASDLNEGDAGNGFSYQDVTFSTNGDGDNILTGAVINQNDDNYRSAIFDIMLYDTDKELIGVDKFLVLNFDSGTRHSFKEILFDVDLEKIDSYKVDFVSGTKE